MGTKATLIMNSFKGKWLADKESYRRACVRASNDLSRFKQDPEYFSHVGNDIRPYETAKAFYDYIKDHYGFLLEYFTRFLKNDEIGSPIIHEVGDNIASSAGTLRFIKVTGDILKRLTSIDSIVEIGAGYGGQCKIIKDCLICDYTIIDIYESLKLSKEYLKQFKIEAGFVDCSKLKTIKPHTLVISDYCLSEMDKEGIDFYMDNVVAKCKYGYFTVNDFTEKDYLIKRLRKHFMSVEITDEEPNTSRHKNKIIICK